MIPNRRRYQSSNYLLEGLDEIARYLGKSVRTTSRWIADHGLPVCQLPSGIRLSSPQLIDQWIYARYLAEKKGDKVTEA